MILHIAQRSDWEMRDADYAPASFDAEGFIHCSTPAQVGEVATRLFASTPHLVLLHIDPEGLPVTYENLEGGSELYPHLYARLVLSHVTRIEEFADGAELARSYVPE